MKHLLEVRLTDTRAGLPRLVSRLHSLALTVERLQVEGPRCRLLVESGFPAERVVAALARLVDVLEVHAVPEQPTRSVVARQPSPRTTTAHPWATPCRPGPAVLRGAVR